jgi:hypothetical protein
LEKKLPGSSSVPLLVPRKKGKPGLLAGMLVGILLVLLLGMAIIVIPRLTAPQTPSGNAIDPSAAAIITDITTSSSVDPMTAAPGPITQTFKTSATINVVFRLNLEKVAVSQDNPVYIQAKFYVGQTFVYQRMDIVGQKVTGGFFEVQYQQPTVGNVELYWCLKRDCSDGKLAQTMSFTVVA